MSRQSLTMDRVIPLVSFQSRENMPHAHSIRKGAFPIHGRSSNVKNDRIV